MSDGVYMLKPEKKGGRLVVINRSRMKKCGQFNLENSLTTVIEHNINDVLREPLPMTRELKTTRVERLKKLKVQEKNRETVKDTIKLTKRKRGRPMKSNLINSQTSLPSNKNTKNHKFGSVKRGRGRPAKISLIKKRGRPKGTLKKKEHIGSNDWVKIPESLVNEVPTGLMREKRTSKRTVFFGDRRV